MPGDLAAQGPGVRAGLPSESPINCPPFDAIVGTATTAHPDCCDGVLAICAQKHKVLLPAVHCSAAAHQLPLPEGGSGGGARRRSRPPAGRRPQWHGVRRIQLFRTPYSLLSCTVATRACGAQGESRLYSPWRSRCCLMVSRQRRYDKHARLRCYMACQLHGSRSWCVQIQSVAYQMRCRSLQLLS